MRSAPACAADGYGGGGSASTSAFYETATGWHVLKVQDYSKHKGVGIARRYKSSTFVVGGHSWCIVFFPDGYSEETAGWACFGLRLEHRGVSGEIKVRHKYSFLDQVGEPVPSSTVASSDVCTFTSLGQTWRHPMFMKKKDMESLHVRDDGFCIRCDVTVIDNICCQVSAMVPPSDLRRHLGDLLASGVGADVTFEVGGETFAGHKNVLAARSSVFMAEFFGCPLKENNVDAATRVAVDDIEPGVFKAMLYFVYTDSLPEIDGGDKIVMAQHLLVAADRYNMERLKSICEYVLCMYIDKSVAVTTLVLAEQHGCHQLKEACIKVLKSSQNYRDVLVVDDLEHLASSCPSLLEELREAGLCDLLENI